VIEHPFFRKLRGTIRIGLIALFPTQGRGPMLLTPETAYRFQRLSCFFSCSHSLFLIKKLYYLKEELQCWHRVLKKKKAYLLSMFSGIVLESCYLTRACLSIHVVTIFKPSLGVGARYKLFFPFPKDLNYCVLGNTH
jgi:hypothetical protein